MVACGFGSVLRDIYEVGLACSSLISCEIPIRESFRVPGARSAFNLLMQQYMIRKIAKNAPVGIIISSMTVEAEVTYLRLEDNSVSSSVSSL